MKKPIVEIYALAVCFICIAFSAIFITAAINSGIKLAYPEFTLSAREYQTYQNNADFLEEKIKVLPTEHAVMYKNMTQEELALVRNSSFQSALESERRRGSQGLLQHSIVIVILALIFALHWKLARKTRRDTAAG